MVRIFDFARIEVIEAALTILEQNPRIVIKFIFCPITCSQTKLKIDIQNEDLSKVEKLIISAKILDDIGNPLILKKYFRDWWTLNSQIN